MNKIFAGMQIIAKYDEDFETCAGHDVVGVLGPSPETLSDEDRQKMEELNWTWDGESWQHFT